MSFESLPYTLGWELTLACNLRCKHCGSSAGQPRNDELTTDEALQLCDQFPALLVQEVDFTGGEPLIRPDWPDIALRLKELGISTGIVTNGTTLDRETVSRLEETGISHVAVSIDGLESTHDFIRGKDGLYRRSMKGLKRLLEQGIPTTIITTVTELNIDELPALFDLFADVGIDRWRPQPLISSGRVQSHQGLLIKERTFLKLIDFYQNWGYRAMDASMELLRADGLGYYFESDPFRGPWYGCPAGLVSVGITSDGKVKGCLSLPDRFIEGDLRENSLWDIWFDTNAFSYTRQFSTSMLGGNCHSCDKGEQCRGGCSAMSYGYTGTFHNDPLCHLGITRRNGCNTINEVAFEGDVLSTKRR
jgi:radical SAM protein with 4Fe4S-binding SPASM domain